MLQKKSFSECKKSGVIQIDNFLYVTSKFDLFLLTEFIREGDQNLQIKKLEQTAFDKLVHEQYSNKENISIEAIDISNLQNTLSGLVEQTEKKVDLLGDEDAPVLQLFNVLLVEAIRKQASDIHIEPFEYQSQIRMRIDGSLMEVVELATEVAIRLVARIKILAKLDIAEKRLPQDGRITVTLAGREVDLRVSTIPTMHGERVVMRILEKQQSHLDLSNLGLTTKQLQELAKLLAKPNGIILVTGPTGSGKTTTLYAALKTIATTDRNIMTIEDPVEYNLAGVSQTQTAEKSGFTFAKGLKAILRQDPDVILLGEIRDNETATIATQASLTGHLVLSTLHTNNATGAVTRMGDLGVEPFLLSSSLRGVLAQRLVRTLCPHCKTERPINSDAISIFEEYSLEPPKTISVPVGCENCNHTGFLGRHGLYELVSMTDELRRLIHDKKGELLLEKKIRESVPSLMSAGIVLVSEQKTTLEEVLKVSAE